MALLQKYQKEGDVVDRMLQDFDDYFHFTNRFPTILDNRDWGLFSSGREIPRVDVKEYDDRLEVNAEIPGLTKEDVSIKIDNNYLVIEGRHQEEKEDKGKYLYKERKSLSFKRAFQLGDSLNKDDINAEYNNGILKVTIPKIEPTEVEIKTIEIK